MTVRQGRGLLAFLCFLFAISSTPIGSCSNERPLNDNDLALEVAVLQTLHRFDLTESQLQLLLKWAPETALPMEARPAAKVKPALRQAMLDLRTALIAAEDSERIAELAAKVDELRSEEGVELDDSIEITETARERTPDLLRRLSARQVGLFIAAYGGEFPDPLEILTEGLEDARAVEGEEWKLFRESISADVGRLVGGLNENRASEVTDKVIQFLIRVRALSDKQFEKQRARLEKEAAEIVAVAGPLEVIQNEVQLALADLLSNPRLEPALKARLKK